MSLKKKVIRGFYWTSGAQFICQVLQIAFTAVLARLLDPADFGLIAMALVFTRFVNMIKGLGLGGAIIQKQETSQEELSSLYWLNIGFTLLLALLLALSAPLGAKFYNQKILTDIILILAVNVFLSSFSAVHGSLLNKALHFKALALIEISVLLISNSTAIILAFMGWGIWSLVARLLLQTLFNTILTIAFSSWRPSLKLNIKKTYSYLNYGIYMSMGNLAFFFTQNIDFILIGKYLNAYALGFYTIAFNLAAIPGDQVKNILIRVLFPSFAKIQGNRTELTAAYHKSIKYLAMVLFPVLFGLSSVSSEFILTIYGHKWTSAIELLPALAMLGIFRGFLHLTNSIILSNGESKLIFKIEVIQAILMVVFISIAVIYFNLLIVAIIYAIIQGFTFFYTHQWSKKFIDTTLKTLFNSISLPLYSSIIMVIGIKALKFSMVEFLILPDLKIVFHLFLLIAVGIALYAMAIWGFDKNKDLEQLTNLLFLKN